MKELGEIKKGRDIGKRPYDEYIWQACPDCGKQQWIRLEYGKPITLRCRSCANRFRLCGQVGDKHPNWKGGRTKIYDYIQVKIYPDDFFYPMANKAGYVLEHRLVMAKHLERCLQSWELVHHKGTKYIGIENRSDNRIENLELTGGVAEHSLEHSRGYRAGYTKV